MAESRCGATDDAGGACILAPGHPGEHSVANAELLGPPPPVDAPYTRSMPPGRRAPTEEQRRRLWRIVAIGLALAAVSIGLAWGGRALGWWGGQTGPSLQPPSAWKSFTSADGGFSIEFPGDAEPISSDGQGLTTNGLFLATSAGTFTVMWADVPVVRADYGPAIARGRAADMSATIVSQGDAEVGGLPGYQFVLAVSKCGPSFPGSCRVTWQVLPSGSRLYQVLTAAPDPPGTNPLTDRFLTSFRPRL